MTNRGGLREAKWRTTVIFLSNRHPWPVKTKRSLCSSRPTFSGNWGARWHSVSVGGQYKKNSNVKKMGVRESGDVELGEGVFYLSQQKKISNTFISTSYDSNEL